MKIAVLGTRMVGQAIATRLIETGHEVCMGAREAQNPAATAWVAATGPRASQGTFAEAAAGAEAVFLCVGGGVALSALHLAGAQHLVGKLLVDLCNPMSAWREGEEPPHLLPEYANTTSLGEQIQAAFPNARVVKSLNTMWCGIMVNPRQLHDGDHDVFMSSNWPEAKATLRGLLQGFGWPEASIIDLGGITTARGPEMFLAMWLRLRLMDSMGSHSFNIKLVR